MEPFASVSIDALAEFTVGIASLLGFIFPQIAVTSYAKYVYKSLQRENSPKP
ncbi:hypothetical protein [Anabaena sp. CCY 9910]|uniref:hypothetical protein n=1 Tax=Anabaena sp. CCY 9910 TaxID=3103870 RepID=UPI0039E1E183